MRCWGKVASTWGGMGCWGRVASKGMVELWEGTEVGAES